MSSANDQWRNKPTEERNCHVCANSHWNSGQWLQSTVGRWPSGLSCASSADAPGQLRDVTCRAPCENFRKNRRPLVRGTPPDDSVRFIPLSQSLYATVDAADYERVNRYKWCVSYRNNKAYAIRTHKHRTISMHRFIMNPPRGKVVDHIDGNGLNNRRANLRICTMQQNCCNRHDGGQSRGVYRYGKDGKYHGHVMKHGRRYYTRGFDNPLDAARARDQLAIQLHGPFAYLNHPDEVQANGGQTQPSESQQPAMGHCLVRTPIWPSPKPKPAPPKEAEPERK